MKQELYDLEITLPCQCGDPFHFVHLGFDTQHDSNHKNPWPSDLYISFRVWHGGLWRRIKAAWKLIWSGWEESYPDVSVVGTDEVEKLRTFCEDCLLAEASSKELK